MRHNGMGMRIYTAAEIQPHNPWPFKKVLSIYDHKGKVTVNV